MANGKPSLRTSSSKVFWKLTPVVLGIIAYFGLGVIERAKNNYNKQRDARVVIKDKGDSNAGNVHEIGIADLQSKLQQNDSWDKLEPYIQNKKIKYQSFKDENELADALNEEVLAKTAAEEKKYQYLRDGLNLNYASERLLLFNKRGEIEAKLGETIDVGSLKNAGDGKKLQPVCFEEQSPPQTKPAKTRAQKTNPSESLTQCKPLKEWETLMARINELEKKYQKEQENIDTGLKDLDKKAQGTIRSIYVDLTSAVSDIKSRGGSASASTAKQAGGGPLKDFNFQSVLDESRSTHVIYQVFRLILIVLLVFGIIAVGLALLKLFPSYADSSEALTDKAKTFLVRDSSAAPNIARAAVVSLAAIGVGTAVVVAGSYGNGQSSVAMASNASGPVTQGNQRREKGKDEGDSTTGATRIIPMPYPVPYPSPVTVNAINQIPPPDGTAIELLRGDVNSLRGSLGGLNTQVGDLQTSMDKDVKPSLDTLAYKVGGIYVPTLWRDVDGLLTQSNDLQHTFFAKLDAVSGKLDAANVTMTGIRNDSLTRLQRPEGRDFFTRVKQFFKPTERYFVSEQAYEVLENLLCTTPCKDKSGTFIGLNKELLKALDQLKTDADQHPMTDKELFNKLAGDSGGENSPIVKPWKSVLLRYTRIP